VVEINLTTGAYRNTYTNASGRYTDFSYNVTTSADGWHRAEMSATTASALNFQMRVYPSNVAWTSGSFGSEYPAGNGTSGIYLWGFQIEQSPTANEYHANLGVSVKYRGTVWTDLSGNGNVGTLVNGVGYNSSNGGSLSFDGINDVVTIPNSASLNPTTGLTIASWVIFDANSQDFIFEKGNVNTQFSLFSHSTDIVFRTLHSEDALYHTQNPSKLSVGVINGQWHNIVGSWNGTTKTIYVDGVLRNSVSKSGNLVTTTPGASVGRFGGTSNGYWFGGSISSVSVYNKGLTAAEIQQNFEAMRGRYGI
jgi:hypothetical protein